MMSAAGSPAAVSIVRHLRALGHAVIGIDAGSETEPLGRAFCDEFHIAPLGGAPEFLDFICQRLSEVDLFMPFVDEELLAIARGWERIPARLTAKIALPEPEVLLECLDKCRFQEACERMGLPIAPPAEAPPAFFKPRFGRGGRGVLHVTDQQMFDVVRQRDGVIQQAITGQEYTVDAIYDRESRLLATSSRRRVKAAGVSTVGEVVPDAQLHILAAQLGMCWPLRFAINFQVMRDREGRDWIIELNPRLAGSAIFSALAGCDPFAATIAVWRGESWAGRPRPLRIWRHWQEWTEPGQSGG